MYYLQQKTKTNDSKHTNKCLHLYELWPRSLQHNGRLPTQQPIDLYYRIIYYILCHYQDRDIKPTNA